MLRVWDSPQQRPTRDIDFLGRTTNKMEDLEEQIREILLVEVEPDGLVFDPISITSEQITEDAAYPGIRIRFKASLDPAPVLWCYSRESTIAEKLEAMATLGALNSRMKDFYDIWLLSRQFNFTGKTIREALQQTFTQRGTPVPAKLITTNEDFIAEKQIQWNAFRKRMKDTPMPESFLIVAQDLSDFLLPLLSAHLTETAEAMQWQPGHGWKQ